MIILSFLRFTSNRKIGSHIRQFKINDLVCGIFAGRNKLNFNTLVYYSIIMMTSFPIRSPTILKIDHKAVQNTWFTDIFLGT